MLDRGDAVLSFLIVLVSLGTGAVLLYPRLARARLWRATSTPLASIIGSGFLVLGPILLVSYGAYAPLVMAGLCLGGYLFGAAIRFNIDWLDRNVPNSGGFGARLEDAGAWALAFAYIVSVAYYLNLLGAFGVSVLAPDQPFAAKLLTTGVFIVILIVGWNRGFGALERLEQGAVGLKLAIIAGLLFGLLWYFAGHAAAGQLVVLPATLSGWGAVTLSFGLLVTVQGFETSRYLGAEYDAPTRIRSMQVAQWLSAVIYMTYILALTYAFHPDDFTLSETAIIKLMALVAPVLPGLLIVAAISAQFSAAVADTGGSGGLIAELTKGRVSARMGYVLLVAVGLLLTWGFSVFEIISHASRAFAVYYAIQSAIAARRAWDAPGARGKSLTFWGLAALGLVIAVFGEPIE